MLNPLLIELPVPIKTPRLLVRPPKAGDGKMLNKAILDSFDNLNRWMPWADHKPTIEESEIVVRTAQARWILREDLMFLLYDPSGVELLGATGLHRINWKLPSFEIGYWVHTMHAGQSIITESTNALVRYAFKQLKAVRVEIRCDEDNRASRRVAEKLHFVSEGILYKNSLKPGNQDIRNTVVYARYNSDNLPDLDVLW
jgi:ribosomal-protein-serine acetyltransferase